MEPNITVRPSPLEVLKAAITLFVLLPCTAIYKTTKWLLSPKNDRGSLKEVFGRALIIGCVDSIEVLSILRPIAEIIPPVSHPVFPFLYFSILVVSQAEARTYSNPHDTTGRKVRSSHVCSNQNLQATGYVEAWAQNL